MMQTQLFNDRTYIYLDGGLVEGGGGCSYLWMVKKKDPVDIKKKNGVQSLV